MDAVALGTLASLMFMLVGAAADKLGFADFCAFLATGGATVLSVAELIR